MTKQTEDPLLFRFFTEVGIIEQLARATLERALPDDLKMSQFIVLNHLVRLGGDWSPIITTSTPSGITAITKRRCALRTCGISVNG